MMRGGSETEAASSTHSRKRKYNKGLQPVGYAKRLSRCKSVDSSVLLICLHRLPPSWVPAHQLVVLRAVWFLVWSVVVVVIMVVVDEDKGQCGDDVLEEHEPGQSVETKIKQIATAIQQARYVVAHTGAGISTAAGRWSSRIGREGSHAGR